MCIYIYENIRVFCAVESKVNVQDAACKLVCMQGGVRVGVWAWVCEICTIEPKLNGEDGAHKLMCG